VSSYLILANLSLVVFISCGCLQKSSPAMGSLVLYYDRHSFVIVICFLHPELG
jgi:hypothetical protein